MVGSITTEQLKSKLDDGNAPQVVDIRLSGQFEQGHIPGAINIPFPEFPKRVDSVDWDDEIVVACPKGESSLQAARMLESYEGVGSDADVLNLDGGYNDWEYELESGAETAASDSAGGDATTDAPF